LHCVGQAGAQEVSDLSRVLEPTGLASRCVSVQEKGHGAAQKGEKPSNKRTQDARGRRGSLSRLLKTPSAPAVEPDAQHPVYRIGKTSVQTIFDMVSDRRKRFPKPVYKAADKTQLLKNSLYGCCFTETGPEDVDGDGFECPQSVEHLMVLVKRDSRLRARFTERLMPVQVPPVAYHDARAFQKRELGLVALFDYSKMNLVDCVFVLPQFGDAGYALCDGVAVFYVCVWVSKDKRHCAIGQYEWISGDDTRGAFALKNPVLRIPSFLFDQYALHGCVFSEHQ
jgi:hypothetical protein